MCSNIKWYHLENNQTMGSNQWNVGVNPGTNPREFQNIQKPSQQSGPTVPTAPQDAWAESRELKRIQVL